MSQELSATNGCQPTWSPKSTGMPCCTVWCWMLAPYQSLEMTSTSWRWACSGSQLVSPICNTSQMRKCKDAWGWNPSPETVGMVPTMVWPHGVCWPRYCHKCCINITSSWEAPTCLTKTKVDGLPEGWHGVPWSKVSRCMRLSKMEKTDLRSKADPVMGKCQDKEKKKLSVGTGKWDFNFL